MKILRSIMFLFFCCLTYSTPQIPDILKYKGRKFELHYFSPAHKYFEDNGLLAPNNAFKTTANYNTFIFTYEIINEIFFLTDVTIYVEKKTQKGFFDIEERSVFKEYFPTEDKIVMNVSSVTVIPYGETVFTEKFGWSDVHSENYLIFEFENGKVKKALDLDYKKFKRKSKEQYKKFKKTEDFLKLINSEKIKIEVELYNEFRPKKLHINAEKLIEKKIFYKIKHIQ